MAKLRREAQAQRQQGYAGASATSTALLRWWFENEHLIENTDNSFAEFRYYFAWREAVERVVWLHDVRQARDESRHLGCGADSFIAMVLRAAHPHARFIA